MHQAFKYAHYLYLTNYRFRESMIKCGMDALMSGIDSENIILLASSDNDDDQTLYETFIKAALEIDLVLPVENSELWLANTSIEFISDGLELPDFDIDTQFKRNLLVIYYELRSIQELDPCLAEFTSIYSKFLGVGGGIDNYEDWLALLQEASSKVAFHDYVEIVSDITGVINWVSYGAISQEHLAMSQAIASKLKEMNLNKYEKNKGSKIDRSKRSGLIQN